MSDDNILITLPDNKGGQLKYRADLLDSIVATHEGYFLDEGDTVHVFVWDDGIGIASVVLDAGVFNRLVLALGRPKGYGVILWHEGGLSFQVMWTPYIGDEGYFDDS